MFNSIQQFETAGIKNLRKAEDEFIRTRGMANFINAIKEVVLHLGLDVIAETLENYDAAIRKSTSASRRMQRPSFLRRLFRQPIGRAERPCRTLPALRPAGRWSAPCKHPFHGSCLPCISRRKPLPDCAFIFRIWRVLPFRDSGILPPVQTGSSHGSVRRWCR